MWAPPMATILPSPPKVGMVSLGCPKALVDSERILTKLRSDGYQLSPDYDSADVVLVNTCGFLDSAKEESLAAIGEAIAENGRVIVTGCMGKEADVIRAKFPGVLAVTGAHQYEQVVGAVHEAAPAPPQAPRKPGRPRPAPRPPRRPRRPPVRPGRRRWPRGRAGPARGVPEPGARCRRQAHAAP